MLPMAGAEINRRRLLAIGPALFTIDHGAELQISPFLHQQRHRVGRHALVAVPVRFDAATKEE